MKNYSTLSMISTLREKCYNFIISELEPNGIKGIVPSHGATTNVGFGKVQNSNNPAVYVASTEFCGVLEFKPDSLNSIFEQPHKTSNQLSNYPNPFNPTTNICYTLDKIADVEIVINDISGRNISNFSYRQQKSGLHNLEFSVANLPSGIYFCQLLINGKTQAQQKMILLK